MTRPQHHDYFGNMANPDHVKIVRKGADAIAKWRRQHPNESFDLSEADLRKEDLSRRDLKNADLWCARLEWTDLTGTQLQNATLTEAHMDHAILDEADLTEAKLKGAFLTNARLWGTRLESADISPADFNGAIVCNAKFAKADCSHANFIKTIGLCGPYCGSFDDIQKSETAVYTYSWDRPCSWEVIRKVGQIPLFGISYFSIFAIVIWTSITRWLNAVISSLKDLTIAWVEALPTSVPGLVDMIAGIPNVPIYGKVKWTLAAIICIAVATTLYKFRCPPQIQEFTEARWAFELRRPLIEYRAWKYSRLTSRWLTAIFYVIGIMWVTSILIRRIGGTFIYLFSI